VAQHYRNDWHSGDRNIHLRAKNFIEISKDVQNGTVTYDIPAEADLDKQKYVLIWCKLFKVNFGSAELQQPSI